ncbi:MAG: DUF1501 domain-containing protein [Gemmataceae bacterium]
MDSNTRHPLNTSSDLLLTRRLALRASMATFAGLSVPGLGLARAALAAKAKSVIFLHQWGGPGQHETFDMKPNAAERIRGDFKPIQSSLPGVPICELLPKMASWMDKVTLIRGLNHTMKNHNSAGYYSLTGYAPPSDDQRLRDSRELFPAYGSIVDRLSPASSGVPTFAALPHVIADGSITPGQHASFLGKRHDPLFVGTDPTHQEYKLPELTLPSSITPERLGRRREALRIVEAQAKGMDSLEKARGINEQLERAFSMVTSTRVRDAFDLSQEKEAVRNAYGRTTYGQSCLVARRLVEVGVRFVNVYFHRSIGGCDGGWDTHGFREKPMNPILKNHLLPMTNQTLPTLLTDLKDRGLLDTTLVVWVGEFGRSPKINNQQGRDHWPQCYTALLAGGGVRKGHVHGASDKTGAFPALDPCKPEDLSATMFHLLGIDPKTEVRDSLNRPLVISPGQVIEGVLS